MGIHCNSRHSITSNSIMATPAATTVSLKILIDMKGQRVLYAEAGKDFVDFLFNILVFMVGTVIRLLPKQGMVGCLANLYESVENLGDTYIEPTTNKDTLLKLTYYSSMATDVPLFFPNIQSLTTQSFYRCPNDYNRNRCNSYYANDPKSICPSCHNAMTSLATFVSSPDKQVSTSSFSRNEGGYVIGVVTYTIMDDLTVTPMSTISSITMLKKLNVIQVDALEEKVVNISINEGAELLKAALWSKTVLSDVFLT